MVTVEKGWVVWRWGWYLGLAADEAPSCYFFSSIPSARSVLF